MMNTDAANVSKHQLRLHTCSVEGALLDHVRSSCDRHGRPPIVVGTPGRLWELYEEGEDHLRRGMATLRYIVLDEADR